MDCSVSIARCARCISIMASAKYFCESAKLTARTVSAYTALGNSRLEMEAYPQLQQALVARAGGRCRSGGQNVPVRIHLRRGIERGDVQLVQEIGGFGQKLEIVALRYGEKARIARVPFQNRGPAQRVASDEQRPLPGGRFRGISV